MKANELRIGNICHKRNGVDCVNIDVIDISQLVKWEETNYSEIPPLLPIPLTEEWLLRMGFACNGGGICMCKEYKGSSDASDLDRFGEIQNPNMLELVMYSSNIYEVSTDTIYICEVSYVHQLQNLYFALTGEELTIKEV